ncbi:aldehyde dehydrogenase family protein [Chryseobacterium joostei]|uniref:Aldehyde dehydrogenase n=1 Tax=Chryseobacterium joostei TaxID=112234 RepID=A0A1N7JFF4_9FLAO|nr:aldehyde dehydrogenase family protein [Chryseobacterium joostei]AZA99547.1 aldehyde dehydrogenase family protein [Chryseobacterium joostei]SIS31109.1 aldehyde dehydrogenase (NAD+) [Chryseobacterium joostei]SIS48102.1 aldehyde dehydrogenase (NAD+) [Chryseobacterium joostei]HCM34461.1 aldehyde dehydrogenase family protein [Chryseobacterium sp.]
MNKESEQKIREVFQQQKAFFKTNQTKDIEFRKAQLRKFREVFLNHTDALCQALFIDLGKSRKEAEYVEIQIVISELDYFLENIDEWAKPTSVPSKQHPSGTEVISKIMYEPYGVNYIIGPFNYPVQLTFSPLIGALISGNTAILKPSENTPHVAKILEKIVKESFEESYVTVIQGAIEENTLLLSLPFDYIFFTGSPNVGKIVMKAAAEQLIPLALELGGKSPTIVHKDADLDKAVERISYGKWINCGQTCVAPDYIYIHESVKSAFIEKFKAHLKTVYNDESLGKIGKIVSQNQIKNLAGYLEATPEKVIYGGNYDLETRHFEATLMDHINWDDQIMQQEIFGPILPIMTYHDINEALEEINNRPKPLALYVFTEDQEFADYILSHTTSGDAEINSTIIHVGSHYLPFGGVGTSGMGKYHGRFSFESFSHSRSVLKVK